MLKCKTNIYYTFRYEMEHDAIMRNEVRQNIREMWRTLHPWTKFFSRELERKLQMTVGRKTSIKLRNQKHQW